MAVFSIKFETDTYLNEKKLASEEGKLCKSFIYLLIVQFELKHLIRLPRSSQSHLHLHLQ